MNNPNSLARLSPLPRAFYRRHTSTVARELLGKLLLRRLDNALLVGRIVETEAYLAEDDAACHAARGRTPRTEVMFGEAGFAYVYAIHAKWCCNVVTQRAGAGCAVLLRAVEPLHGIEFMRTHRNKQKLLDLTRGPARLCAAFAIDRELNGHDLTTRDALWITNDPKPPTATPAIEAGPRVGVSSAQHHPLRFSIADHRFVSLPRRVRLPDASS